VDLAFTIRSCWARAAIVLCLTARSAGCERRPARQDVRTQVYNNALRVLAR
jgi:hypothetical protein